MFFQYQTSKNQLIGLFILCFRSRTYQTHLDMKISKFHNEIEEIFGGFTELIEQQHRMCAQNEDMTKFKCIHIANNIIITRLGVYF